MTWVGPDPWQAPGQIGGADEFLPPGAPGVRRALPDAAGAMVAEWVSQVGKLATPLLLLGAPAGLLWAHLSPGINVVATQDGPSFPDAETEEAFSVDMSFLLITLLAGLACGFIAWQWKRRSGTAAPVGLVLGGLLASLVARAVGERVILDETVARICSGRTSLGCLYYNGHLHLRATGLLVAWPLAALVVYLVLTAVLDRDDTQPVPVDWGYYAAPEPYRPTA